MPCLVERRCACASLLRYSVNPFHVFFLLYVQHPQSPTLLIPKCCNADSEPMAVIKVDQLSITSEPKNTKNLSEVERELQANQVDFFYHTFNVALKGMYGALTTVGKEVAGDIKGRNVMVANFDFGLEAKICNKQSNDLASVKCAAEHYLRSCAYPRMQSGTHVTYAQVARLVGDAHRAHRHAEGSHCGRTTSVEFFFQCSYFSKLAR